MDSPERDLFLREARAAARLHHPHIVSVHEVGRVDDRIYIVSDFVAGSSLEDWLKKHRVTSQESAALAVKLAEALEHAHQSGIIHRDLKPANGATPGRQRDDEPIRRGDWHSGVYVS
jgi:serine/threonine-protein kinase